MSVSEQLTIYVRHVSGSGNDMQVNEESIKFF